MKFFHLSDLHLGRRIYEFSLIDDQKYILKEILRRTDEEHPDAVVIAGDIYDRAVPSAEAVELFDSFLTELAGRHIPVLAIAGNHDSPERIAFGAGLMSPSGVYLSPVYNGRVEPVHSLTPMARCGFICSRSSSPRTSAAFIRTQSSRAIPTRSAAP